MIKLKYTFTLVLFLITIISHSQPASDEQLAQYYMQTEDFENAKLYYNKLYKKKKTKFYYNKLLSCYLELNELNKAEKFILKQIKHNQLDVSYQFDLGKIYEQTNRKNKAKELYEKTIKELSPVVNQILDLSKLFKNSGKYDFALKTLEKGRKIIGKQYDFNFYFSEIYSFQGKIDKMIEEHLLLLKKKPQYYSIIEKYLSRQINFEHDNKENNTLRIKLLEAIRKHPNVIEYDKLLIWYFIQKKEFNSAFVQVKALDKKSEKNGRYVFNLGNVTLKNKKFDVAEKCFLYVKNYGKANNPLYERAENKLLDVMYQKLITNRKYTHDEMKQTLFAFEKGIDRIGKNKNAIPSIKRYAEILAFYSNQPQKAKHILEEAINFPGVKLEEKSKLKILLGDINVTLNDIWGASVLYLQVEHDFKHDKLGHLAKFKNAKVYFYDGDFKWAQAQLDVLKSSTTKLIANDALKLSLFIMDNLGIDSTLAPMKLFAKADLLIQQRKFNDAINILDSIKKNYPFHSLNDDIIMKKAVVFEKQAEWKQAIHNYIIIYDDYKESILFDDALYRIAKIYENHLIHSEKAKEYFKKILFESKGSLYSVEARKKINE